MVYSYECACPRTHIDNTVKYYLWCMYKDPFNAVMLHNIYLLCLAVQRVQTVVETGYGNVAHTHTGMLCNETVSTDRKVTL